MFTVDGIYDDYIYGEFKGRRNIAMMLPTHFHRDAKNFSWEMYDLINNDCKGYARYRFSFTSTLAGSEHLKVATFKCSEPASVEVNEKRYLAYPLQSLLIRSYISQEKFLASL